MKWYKTFILFTVMVGSFVVCACSSLSPSPIDELVGEWQTLDGYGTLKINSDGVFTSTGGDSIIGSIFGNSAEGRISISNDYEIYFTSKDNKTNFSTYFFIKDNRLFLGAFIMEGNGDSIKAKWKNQVKFKVDSQESTFVNTCEFRNDGKVILGFLNMSATNDYTLIDGKKDIASFIQVVENNNVYTNCYVLAGWKGKKMMYLIRIDDYDSYVLKKK